MERHMYVVFLIVLLFHLGVSQNDDIDCLDVRAELEKFMSNYSGRVETILDYLSDSFTAGPASLTNATNNCTCDCSKTEANATATIVGDGDRSLMLFTTEGVKTTEIICEHKTRTLRCENGTLAIKYASYGRSDLEPCPHKSIRTTNCSAALSESHVISECNGKTSCTLTASNRIFGDPCHGTFKYLQVT